MTDTLNLNDSSNIAINSFGSGQGSSLIIDANSSIIINSASIQAANAGTGLGGQVSLDADSLTLSNLGSISTADNAGQSGTVTLEARQVLLQDGGRISTTSAGGSGSGGNVAEGAGDAGGIIVKALDKIELFENSLITTEALKASAGQVTIIAPNLVYLLDSRITTSVLGRNGDGDGGDIFIDPEFVVLNNSLIQANAVFGNGGNITIIAQEFLQSEGSIVEASSEFGLDGNILIVAPNVDLTAALLGLPSEMLDADSWKIERCSVRLGGTSSSFVLSRREGVPSNPEDLLSSGFLF